MVKGGINVVERFSILEKLFYAILSTIFYPAKYMTLIPHFILKGSFTRLPSPKNSTICVKDTNDEKIYRDISSKDKLKVGYYDHKSITDIIRKLAIKDPQKRCIASRPVIEKEDYVEKLTGRSFKRIHFGAFIWKTFEQVNTIIDQYSYGLASIDLLTNPENKVAIFADNCEEWFISSQAIISTGCQLVTVYTTLPDDGIVYAINFTNTTHIVVDGKSLNRLLHVCDKLEHVKHVILMSSCENSQYEDHAATEIFTFHTIQQLCVIGAEILASEDYTKISPTIDDSIAVIMFTSGSSGTPKGVKLSHKNVLTQVGSEIDNRKQWENKLYAAFLPSSHVLEFIVELSIITYGGMLGFCTPVTLTDKSPMIIPGTIGDLPELKPNITLFVPLLLDRLSKAVQQHLKSQSRTKQTLIQFLIDYKKHFLRKGHKTPLVDKLVFSKIAAIVGGIADVTLSAGAPLCSELSLFSSVVFCLNLKQGYGTTETCCGGSLGLGIDPYSNDVGHITPSNELKIVPWEEGGYHPNDKPNPRGEVIIGGANVSHGYYKNDDLTNESFAIDQNGMRWFRTGDIVQLLPNGHIQIIDRKKDIIKLKHGEYVCITRIESILSQSKFIDMICIAPNSDSSYLVAIILPNRQQIVDILQSVGKEVNDDFSIHISDQSICDTMIENIKSLAMTLHKFDRPEKYFFVTELWTPENNQLTPSMKIKRVEIQKQYKHLLE